MSAHSRPEPGTRMTFRWRKWDGSAHWEHDCVYLGADDFGDWFGQPAGWRSHRPGRDLRAGSANVTLLPPEGDHVLTLNAEPADYAVYIDLAWDARWSGAVPTGIDMDLDVIRARDRRGTWIDDRDEWEEHRARYGYPAEVVAHLEAAADELEVRVRAQEDPYSDHTAARWLSRLAALLPADDTGDGASPSAT